MHGFEVRYLELRDGQIACWFRPASKGKPVLLMGHGNGLSALTQIGLMRELSDDFDVQALDFRGHGASRLPTPRHPDNPWAFYVKDLQEVIERHFGGQVAYAAHSLGAVTAIRLGLKRPDLFSQIIAIDPAILPNGLARVYPLVKHIRLLAKRNRLYIGALKRRNHWDSRTEALTYFTGRKALATWPDEAVAAYVDSATKLAQGGSLTLACDRTWEARTFKHVPAEIGFVLRDLSVPTLLLRAVDGSIYPASLPLNQHTRLVSIDGDHFIHLANSTRVAQEILKFLVR